MPNFGRVLTQRARIQGFIVTDFAARFPEGYQRLVEWHLAGKLKYRVDEVAGLQHAPEALLRLFNGKNEGKLVVKVSEP
jgi:NADPH-dependent curcumin reductase CurA